METDSVSLAVTGVVALCIIPGQTEDTAVRAVEVFSTVDLKAQLHLTITTLSSVKTWNSFLITNGNTHIDKKPVNELISSTVFISSYYQKLHRTLNKEKRLIITVCMLYQLTQL